MVNGILHTALDIFSAPSPSAKVSTFYTETYWALPLKTPSSPFRANSSLLTVTSYLFPFLTFSSDLFPPHSSKLTLPLPHLFVLPLPSSQFQAISSPSSPFRATSSFLTVLSYLFHFLTISSYLFLPHSSKLPLPPLHHFELPLFSSQFQASSSLSSPFPSNSFSHALSQQSSLTLQRYLFSFLTVPN